MEAVSKEWHILISPRSPSGCALSLARNGQSGHAPSTKQSQQFGHVKGVPSISWAPGTGTLQGHREDLPFHLELDEVTSLDKHSGTVNLSLREDLLNHITVVYSFDTPTYPKGDRDYIGFATLPEQVHRKSVKRGFDFTLMVVGEAGLGKSTLVNSLFLSDLYKDRTISTASDRINKTTSIEKKSMDIEERGVKLRLTVVDTPGFGDAVNCEDSWRACCNYIDDQFRQYFNDESGLNRKNIQDNRVHCCLYFIPPYGHGLRQIDLELMRRLHSKVNIVPVIAKADTLTAAEVKRLKQRILQDIEENQIQIYQFPECDSDEDEEFKQQDRELKACVPFAVVGSNTVIEVGGCKVRGRQYPWGVVEVENPKHSDFSKLRNMLITTHMQDLKDITEDVHYENFRAQCISQISQASRERGKLKRDSGPALEGVITETDRLLLQKDEEIRRMQDMLTQMQEKLKATASRDSIVNV
ncbi:Septin-4 [Homalodisca vitripennis]|nr:Septin-4 [Homalodisca vitripennis]